jgi:hypothetical protein
MYDLVRKLHHEPLYGPVMNALKEKVHQHCCYVAWIKWSNWKMNPAYAREHPASFTDTSSCMATGSYADCCYKYPRVVIHDRTVGECASDIFSWDRGSWPLSTLRPKAPRHWRLCGVYHTAYSVHHLIRNHLSKIEQAIVVDMRKRVKAQFEMNKRQGEVKKLVLLKQKNLPPVILSEIALYIM